LITRILHASCISFSMTVKCFTWIAHRLAPSNNSMRKNSTAFWSVRLETLWLLFAS
jgi:hypothetical protein